MSSPIKSHGIMVTILLLAIFVSAIAVVYAQHQSRKLYMELQKQQLQENELNIHWGRLRLQWAALTNANGVELKAQKNLGMQYVSQFETVEYR